MNCLSDQQLLRDYAERRSEAAFAELVRRHVDFIHSAAVRMVCDAHLAKDVTQGVFIALAQNARQLADRPVLSGWMHRTAQNLAANTVRSEVRRRAREQEASAMNELLSAKSGVNWEDIAPDLDAGLGELEEADRDALLLRYFERKSAREMAEVLGTSEDAAQKRVSRAVERLREFFAKRELKIGASGLAVLISANAVHSAPVGLTTSILTAAAVAGTTGATATTATATKIIVMTTLQKTTLIALIAVLGGGGIYQAHKALQRHNPVQLTQPSQESKETKEAKKYAGVMAGMASLFFKNGDNIILTNMNQFRKLPPGAVWSDLALNLDKFEIVSNAAPVKWTYPDVVLLRERTPRRTEDGKWARVYGMVDGQALEQISEDGNFDTWEKQHLMPPPNNP